MKKKVDFNKLLTLVESGLTIKDASSMIGINSKNMYQKKYITEEQRIVLKMIKTSRRGNVEEI